MAHAKTQPHNLYEVGDVIKARGWVQNATIISLFYLPIRKNYSYGISELYDFPELLSYEDADELINEDNILTLTSGWHYFVSGLLGRDDQIVLLSEAEIFHPNELSEEIQE